MMAESSREWRDFEMARDMWQTAVICLERAAVEERELRWKMNEAARKLEKKGSEAQ
jgi:hypothetical protein